MRRNRWWTRARCVEAGARFYRDHGVAPTNEGWWQEWTQFTANAPGGASNAGSKRPYPSTGPIKNFWKSFRDFWKEVAAAYPDLGIHLDKGDLPWSPLEEWFITESVGVIPRAEVARLMDESGCGRTEPAIKRRLYEMGINSYNRWGWTINHVERVLGVSAATVHKYLAHGALPYYRSHKCIYVDPADLFLIREYNWAKKRHPRELEEAVRKSLMLRACYALLGFDWRRYAYHQPHAEHEYYTGRIKQRRVPKPPTEPKPTHVRVGDWVTITGEWSRQSGAKGRVGQVKSVVWSPQRAAGTQKRPARPACWIVTVEFRKQKTHGNNFPRVRYNLPASSVERTNPPPSPVRELKPQPPRRKRKERMKVVGTTVLNNRLKVSALQAVGRTAKP